MLVPAVLKGSWAELEDPIHLSSYYIKFCPAPEDRIYKNFGLFVKAPLPLEAERMELDLHLARGRSVFIELVPSGLSEFNKDEVNSNFVITCVCSTYFQLFTCYTCTDHTCNELSRDVSQGHSRSIGICS